MARPSSYTEEIAFTICEKIATSSNGIHAICKEEGMPSPSTVFKWLTEHKEFSDMYTRAKELQAEFLKDELLSIADDSSNDTISTEKGDFPNNEWINRSRLRVDTRKWLMSKLLPRVYGEKIDHTTAGEKINNAAPIIKVYASGPPLSSDEDNIAE